MTRCCQARDFNSTKGKMLTCYIAKEVGNAFILPIGGEFLWGIYGWRGA